MMTLGLAFWIIWLVGLILGIGWAWPRDNYVAFGSGLIPFLLITILGWASFGAPIHG